MADPKVHLSYPAVRYGSGGQTCVVADAAAEKALGPGWYDSPKKVPPPPPKPPAKAKE